jgi:hypothetical protein
MRTIGTPTWTSSRSKRMAARVQQKVDMRTSPRCICPMRWPRLFTVALPEGHFVA